MDVVVFLQKNAIVLLTSLIILDESIWKQLVVEQHTLVSEGGRRKAGKCQILRYTSPHTFTG